MFDDPCKQILCRVIKACLLDRPSTGCTGLLAVVLSTLQAAVWLEQVYEHQGYIAQLANAGH